jgi:hypothetical protein
MLIPVRGRVHSDSHSDVAAAGGHGDAHSDAAGSHSDSAHADTGGHGDQAHHDYTFAVAHLDHGDGNRHDDYSGGSFVHEDWPHGDGAGHGDVAHDDRSTGSGSGTTFGDPPPLTPGASATYVDSHDDWSAVGHTDVGHGDATGAHGDAHDDYPGGAHSDLHTDSW